MFGPLFNHSHDEGRLCQSCLKRNDFVSLNFCILCEYHHNFMHFIRILGDKIEQMQL